MRAGKANRLLARAVGEMERGRHAEAQDKLAKVIDANVSDRGTLLQLTSIVFAYERITGQPQGFDQALAQLRAVSPVYGCVTAATCHMTPTSHRPSDYDAAARELERSVDLIKTETSGAEQDTLNLQVADMRAMVAARSGRHHEAWQMIDEVKRRAATLRQPVPNGTLVLEHRDGQPIPATDGITGDAQQAASSVASQTIQELRTAGWTGIRGAEATVADVAAPAPPPVAGTDRAPSTGRSTGLAPAVTLPDSQGFYAQAGMERAGFTLPRAERPGVTHALVLSDGQLVTRSPNAIALQPRWDAQATPLSAANDASGLLELGGELAVVTEDTLVFLRPGGNAEWLSEKGAITAATSDGDRLATLTPKSGLQVGTYDAAGQIHLEFLSMAMGVRDSLMSIVQQDLVAISMLSMVTVVDRTPASLVGQPSVHVRPRHNFSVNGAVQAMTASSDRYLAIGDETGQVRVYDLADSTDTAPQPIISQDLHRGPVGALFTLPNGDIVSGGTDGCLVQINPERRTVSNSVQLPDPVLGGGAANGMVFVRCPFHWVPLTL